MNWLYRRWYLGKDKGTEVIKGLSRLESLELINQWNKQSTDWKYELLEEITADNPYHAVAVWASLLRGE